MDCLMKPILNKCDAPYLEWIKSGIKQYEGRLQSKITDWDLSIDKFEKVKFEKVKFEKDKFEKDKFKENKFLILYDQDNPNNWVKCEITELLLFSDFGTAFDNLGDKLIPERSRNDVIHLYNKLFHYPDEYPNEFNDGVTSKCIIDNGVVAIGLKIISMS